MSAPNPPQNLQVQPAQEVQQPQAQPQVQQPEPKKDYVDPGPAEDRILSPEETMNFFRTGSLTDPDANQDQQEKELAEMAADFFKGIPKEPQAAQQQVPQAPSQQVMDSAVQQDQQQQKDQQQQLPPLQPQQFAPPPAPTPQEAALHAQMSGMAQQIQQLTQQIATQQVKQGTDQQAQQPQFNFQVPSQYAEAIASDDPNLRLQAINSLLNGVAATVHQQTLKDVDSRIQGITPVVQRQVQEAQSQADIKKDMYGTYPELTSMMDMVVATASQLSSDPRFQQWSPDYRDAIAERLSPLVPGLAQRVQQHRASRGQVYQQPQYAQQQQFLPQVQQPQGLPPGIQPVQIQGGAHVGAPQPILVRDAQGNISQVYPQHQQQVAGGAHSRPNGQGIDPGLQDIWSTLGYT